MSNDETPGLDEPSCDPLKFGHIIVIVVQSKLVNVYIRVSFGFSYAVPIRKCDVRICELTVRDFRSISFSLAIFKLFKGKKTVVFTVFVRP